MSGSGSVTHYRLTPAAREDLEDIWLFSAHAWSIECAERHMDALEKTLDLLVSMPRMAPRRTEFDPPVRVYPSVEHVIVYRIKRDHLVILRVLGGRQDWFSILRTIDQ